MERSSPLKLSRPSTTFGNISETLSKIVKARDRYFRARESCAGKLMSSTEYKTLRAQLDQDGTATEKVSAQSTKDMAAADEMANNPDTDDARQCALRLHKEIQQMKDLRDKLGTELNQVKQMTDAAMRADPTLQKAKADFESAIDSAFPNP